MRTPVFPLLLCLALPPVAAHAADGPHHKLVCPAQAPAEWGIPRGALSGVEVLSNPKGSTIDDSAPPSLVPDRQIQQGDRLRQIWQMNGEGPNWAYYVDCHYRGAPRVLRLDAAGVTSCERSLSASHADGPQTLVCD